MHPIERLRYVARASGAAQELLVQETARALAAFSDDPHALVTACRRIVARQPTSGPLLWLTARVLTAGDPLSEIWEASGLVAADPTAGQLAHALPEGARLVVLGWPGTVGDALVRRGDLTVLVVDVLGEGSGLVRRLLDAEVEAVDVPLSALGSAVAGAELVLLEATAIGPVEALAVSGSLAAAAVARHLRVPVWLVGGVGRLLPQRMWEGLRARAVDAVEPWEAEDEVLPLDLVDRIVGPAGPETVEQALRRTDCPVATELFRGDVL